MVGGREGRRGEKGVGWKMYHGLQADWLYEAVEDLCKRLRTDPRPAHFVWIAVHTTVPVLAERFHRWHPALHVASVLDVFSRAHGHVGHHLDCLFFGFHVDVGADGSPEGVGKVAEGKAVDQIHGRLGVVGDEVGKVGIFRQGIKDCMEIWVEGLTGVGPFF